MRAAVRQERLGERKKNRLRNEQMSDALLRHALVMCGVSDDEDDMDVPIVKSDHAFLFQSVAHSDPELYQLFRHGMEGLLLASETSASDARRVFDRESFTNRLLEVRKSLKDIRQVLQSAHARALVNQLEHLIHSVFKPTPILAGFAAAVLATGAGAELTVEEQERLTNVREKPSPAALAAAGHLRNFSHCPIPRVVNAFGLVEDEIGHTLTAMSDSSDGAGTGTLYKTLWDAGMSSLPSVTASAISKYLPGVAANLSPESAGKPEDGSVLFLFGLRAWQRKVAHAAAKTYGLRSVSYSMTPPARAQLVSARDQHLHEALLSQPSKVLIIFPNLKPINGTPAVAPPLTLAQILLPLPVRYNPSRTKRDGEMNLHSAADGCSEDADESTQASPSAHAGQFRARHRTVSADRRSNASTNDNERDASATAEGGVRTRSRSRSAPRQLAALQLDSSSTAGHSSQLYAAPPVQPEVMFRVAGEAVAHAKAVERKADRATKRAQLAAIAAKEFARAQAKEEGREVSRERSASANKKGESDFVGQSALLEG